MNDFELGTEYENEEGDLRLARHPDLGWGSYTKHGEDWDRLEDLTAREVREWISWPGWKEITNEKI